jgi:hypothetical protein
MWDYNSAIGAPGEARNGLAKIATSLYGDCIIVFRGVVVVASLTVKLSWSEFLSSVWDSTLSRIPIHHRHHEQQRHQQHTSKHLNFCNAWSR